MTDTWQLRDLMEATELGARGADKRVAVRRDAPAGCVFYGPFWQLRQGAYRLAIECGAREPLCRSHVVVGVEIVADIRRQVTWRDFTIDELTLGQASIDFVVPAELSQDAGGAAAFEFRVYHLGNAELSLGAIELRRLPGAPEACVGRRWRLAPRSASRWFATMDREGFVAIPRWARRGQFLRGVQPQTLLPAGRYRLRFCCWTGAPRRPRQPVLSVEIVNGEVSHQSYFYAAELAAGSSHLDFAAPDGSGVESGSPARLAVRFLHHGNAALAVGAIELVLVAREADTPPAPEASFQELTLQFGETGAQFGRTFGSRLPQRKTSLAGPLRLGLRSAPVRLAIRPHPGLPGASPHLPLCTELAAELADRRGWRRLLPLSRGAGLDRTRRARWDLTASNIGADPGSLGTGGSEAWQGFADREAPFDLRLVGQPSAALSLARVDVKKVRPGNRKNLLLFGNCHVLLIYQGFLGIPALRRYFRPKCLAVNLQPQFYDEARRDLAQCELLLVQDIADWESYPLREAIGDQTQIVKFPCVRFASLWPFDRFNGAPDAGALALEGENLTFPYLDGLLARLRKEIRDPETRFRAYRSLEVAGITNYARAHQFESRRLLAMDRRFSCKIGEFILEHFQNEQIFYTTNHPNGRIFELMIANIMQTLGISGQIPQLPELDQMHTVQVPVHPKIAEALGVVWATPERTYQFRQEHLTWEQYVRRYIACYG